MTAPPSDFPERAGALAQEVLAQLVDRGDTLAVAESLTGGLLAATLVAVPGASAAFRGGVVSYATDLKASLLGVNAADLARTGPIDPAVAAQMAAGVRRVTVASWGVSTTGVAGPAAQDGHEPGEVYVAVAGPRCQVRRLTLVGDRDEIRTASVVEALRLLQDGLAGTANGAGGPTPLTS